MTVKELKKILEIVNDNLEVGRFTDKCFQPITKANIEDGYTAKPCDQLVNYTNYYWDISKVFVIE
jgi:hypothetical protein